MRTVTRLRVLLAVLGALAAVSAVARSSLAQTAADHVAQAHGKPITGGHDIQPTPSVKDERWRHHMMMLKAQEAARAGKPSVEETGPAAGHGRR